MAVSFIKNPTPEEQAQQKKTKFQNFIKNRNVPSPEEVEKNLAAEEADLAREKAEFEAMKAAEQPVEEVKNKKGKRKNA